MGKVMRGFLVKIVLLIGLTVVAQEAKDSLVGVNLDEVVLVEDSLISLEI